MGAEAELPAVATGHSAQVSAFSLGEPPTVGQAPSGVTLYDVRTAKGGLDCAREGLSGTERLSLAGSLLLFPFPTTASKMDSRKSGCCAILRSDTYRPNPVAATRSLLGLHHRAANYHSPLPLLSSDQAIAPWLVIGAPQRTPPGFLPPPAPQRGDF